MSLITKKSSSMNEKLEYDIRGEIIPTIENLTKTKLRANIGVGGFSIVKLVYREEEKKYYALKVINLRNKKFQKKAEIKNRELIHNEIKIHFMLKNKNIVELNSYFEYNEYIFLLMEFLSNQDLKHFIKKYHYHYQHSQISEILCCFFIKQILDALFYLKEMHILHRDIKLENIMLSNDFTVKVGDFSLSKIIDLNSKFITSRSGTAPYLSPECIKKNTKLSSKSCFKADIFSLGVVMYWMLFNTHPFEYKVKYYINNIELNAHNRIQQSPK